MPRKVRKQQVQASEWPGITHRYVQYDPPCRLGGYNSKYQPTDFKRPRRWVHTVYDNGVLVSREVMQPVDVEIAIAIHEAMEHVVRGSEMPDTVNLFEVFERA